MRAVITYLGAGKITFNPAQPDKAEKHSTLSVTAFNVFQLANYHTSWKRAIRLLPSAWRIDFVVTIDIEIVDKPTRELIFDKMGMSRRSFLIFDSKLFFIYS